MRRFFLIMLCAFSVLSMGMGAAAHAVETVVCAEAESGPGASHSDTGKQESPDRDKGISHQHASCHGHHVAAPLDGNVMSALALTSQLPAMSRERELPASSSDPALRPPQA
jgi:hypothetical protein